MADTATPNVMPGAQQSTDTTDSAQQTAQDDAQESTANSGEISADERAELARLREVHKDEQKWRRQATENHSDAEKYRKLLDGFGVAPEKGKEFDAQKAISDLNSKFEKAEQARIRSEVARTEKVDPNVIHGATEEEMRVSAKQFRLTVEAEVEKRTKAVAPAAAPASDVTANGKVEGSKQITSQRDLKNMSAKQISEARKAGLLDDLLSGAST
jgi:hypothetical protein